MASVAQKLYLELLKKVLTGVIYEDRPSDRARS